MSELGSARTNAVEPGLETVEGEARRLLGRSPEAPAGEGTLLQRVEAAVGSDASSVRAVLWSPDELPLGSAAGEPTLVLDAESERVARLGISAEARDALRVGPAGKKVDPGFSILLSGVGSRKRSRILERLQASGVAATAGEEVSSMAVLTLAQESFSLRGPAARLAVALVLDGASILTWAGLWWVLGSAAFGGRLSGWLFACVLMVLLRSWIGAAASWLRSSAFQQIAEDLRRQIFELLLVPSRRDEAEVTSRLSEIEQIEAYAHHAMLGLAMALLEAALAAWVMGRGVAPASGALVLLSGVLMLLILGVAVLRETDRWSASRVALTRGAAGRVARHRRRLIFGDDEVERAEEDAELASYAERSRSMDRAVLLAANLPYRWVLVVGILSLLPGFHSAAGEALAVSVLGVVLAAGAVGRAADALPPLAVALASGRRLASLAKLFGRRGEKDEAAGFAPPRPVALMEWGDLNLHRGEKVVAAGEPVGEIRLGGVPLAACGKLAAARRVAIPPAGAGLLPTSLALNLLGGACWPPRKAELEAACSLLERLDLGELVLGSRGLEERVGAGGRPLSDGEQARLLLARTLLRQTDFAVLDRPLAALDPPLQRKTILELESSPAGILALAPRVGGRTEGKA